MVTKEQAYDNHIDAKSRVKNAIEWVSSSRGVNNWFARVALHVANWRYERVDAEYRRAWPDDSVHPGTMTNPEFGEDGNTRFGVVQPDGSIARFSVPTEPLVPLVEPKGNSNDFSANWGDDEYFGH